jgi:Fic family protein
LLYFYSVLVKNCLLGAVLTRTTGTYENTTVAGEGIAAFVPHPLPPYGPRLELRPELTKATERAEAALARLELAGAMVPSVDWLIYSFVRKEAVLSSQIEGTQATLIDLLTYEADSKIDAEEAHVEEVCNYVDALGLALTQLDTRRGLPISMRLLNRAHGMLLKGARGSGRSPGKVRRNQNWIGGTRPGNAVFVPLPPHRLAELLTQFERYIHAEEDLAPLLRAGLLHVQFETIHPYLDGNGSI